MVAVVCMDEEELGYDQDFMVVKYLKPQGIKSILAFKLG